VRVANWQQLATLLRTGAGVTVDGQVVRDIMTEQRGAAVRLLLRIKTWHDEKLGKTRKEVAQLKPGMTLTGLPLGGSGIGTRAKRQAAEASLSAVDEAIARGLTKNQVRCVPSHPSTFAHVSIVIFFHSSCTVWSSPGHDDCTLAAF
jgi:hypothetical protein